MEYKYTLIISQYYHSRHMFICNLKEDFIEKAKSLSYELMEYKRDENVKRELYAGDLDYTQDEKIHGRYNINDAGDIYFIQSDSINHLMFESRRYWEDSYRQSKGYQSKRVTEGIADHHNFGIVKGMVKQHFEIL